MGRTLNIKEVDNKTRFKNVKLHIKKEKGYISEGIAFMPLMGEKFYPIKASRTPAGLNTVEVSFVKFLYKIRNANKNKQKIDHDFFTSHPNRNNRERVFIAGHIFPIMQINVRKTADALKIEKGLLSDRERELLGGMYHHLYSNHFINIDNHGIRILLPKQNHKLYSYVDLLYDFLTNGEKTKKYVKYGEFPDLKTCGLAHNNSYNKLPDGCWLSKDRKANNDTWKKGCEYVIKNKLKGVLAPFSQIADFYEYVDKRLVEYKHNIRWTKGAKKLVIALEVLEGGFIFVSDDVEVVLSELNLGICDFAITQFYELFNGKYKSNPLTKLKDAYEFDKQFVEYEQGTVAPPVYSKTPKKTIATFQAMADKDISLSITDSAQGIGGAIFGVTPEFDDPWEAKVTDSQFRIDLPLLMLWLDRHKPTAKAFKNKVDKNGYLLEKYKKIIRAYDPVE